MIRDILTASGIPYRQGRYPFPPAETYVVYFDELDTSDGPDPVPGAPQLVRHNCSVELYEPEADPAAEERLEALFAANGLRWTKQDRYWLQNTQRYQVVYEFSFTEKRRA